MGRARMIYPQLFTHEALFDAEQASGLPLRLVFVGLLTVADREGRFEVRPRRIKSDVDPYGETDIGRCIEELTDAGFLVRYTVDEHDYAVIPSFLRWQRPHPREAKSKIPRPPEELGTPSASQGSAKGEAIPVGYSSPSGPSSPSSPSDAQDPRSPAGESGKVSSPTGSQGDTTALLAELRAAYPYRPGDGIPAEEEALQALLDRGADPETILAGARAYAEHCGAENTEPQYVKRLVNWLREGFYLTWSEARRSSSMDRLFADWATPSTVTVTADAEAPAADEGPDFEVDLPAKSKAELAREWASEDAVDPEERRRRRRETLYRAFGRDPETKDAA